MSSTTCSEAHHGLCVSRDRRFFASAKSCAETCMKLFLPKGHLAASKLGTVYLVDGTWKDGGVRSVFYVLSGRRSGHKKFVLFTECEYHEYEGLPCLRLLVENGALCHASAYSLVQRFFAVTVDAGNELKALSVYPLKTMMDARPGRPLCSILWPGKERGGVHAIWPVLKPATLTGPAAAKQDPLDVFGQAMEAGFRDLACESAPRKVVKTIEDSDGTSSSDRSFCMDGCGQHFKKLAPRQKIKKGCRINSKLAGKLRRKRRPRSDGVRKDAGGEGTKHSIGASGSTDPQPPVEVSPAGPVGPLARPTLPDDDILLSDLAPKRARVSSPEPPAPAHRAQRGGRFVEAFGSHLIFELHPGGVHTGYSIHCARHLGVDGQSEPVCASDLTFAGKQSMTPDECIRRLKRWVIKGYAIPVVADSRSRHMRRNWARSLDAELTGDDWAAVPHGTFRARHLAGL